MSDFTPAQLSAIEYRRLDACVIAGPGAGKTTVLVERYRQLIEIHGLEPRQILAITFTEKAAANMKAKLAEQFAHDPIRRRDLESGYVSTIHGFCVRLLREYAIAAGLDPRFAVLSPRESDNLQWECLNTALDELTRNRREATLELIEALHSPALIGELKDVYDGIRSAGKTIEEVRNMPNPDGTEQAPRQIATELRALLAAWPWDLKPKQVEQRDRLLEWCGDFELTGPKDFATYMKCMSQMNVNLTYVPRTVSDAMKSFREGIKALQTAEVDRHAAPFRELIFDVLARFDEEYRGKKTERSRVDFNDLERHAIALLKNDSDVRRRVHTQFRQVMLDEFQDINGQQAELIRLLRPEDVFFGVGDINQSIYGFRHARPEIFLQYRDDVAFRSGHSVDLLHNFRSREAILACVREVLAGAEGIEDRDLISGANFAGKEEASVEILEIRDEADDKDTASAREAAWIAHRIQSLHGVLHLGPPGETRPADFGDFAVLCRNSDSMEPILAAFDRVGIPYVSGRRPSFVVSREGLDITALLSVIANPRDGISLATLLRSPLIGVSDEALLRLRLNAGSLTSGLNHYAHSTEPELSNPDATILTKFCKNLERWRQDQPILPLDLLLARALSDCNVAWNQSIEAWSQDTEAFIELARTSGTNIDLPSFLHELETLAEATDLESELSDEEQGNCVRVMTAHSAKGLEFPVTIIAAMDKGARNESSPVTFTPEHGIGVKWRNPASKEGKDGFREGLKDSWAEANSVVSGARETSEENRLLYVAMTRAEEHLILSWSRGKNKPSNWAKRIDASFHVSQRPSSPHATREPHPGFDATVLVTDSDPPYSAHSGIAANDSSVQVVAKPVIEDQHETNVTVTSLAVFGACPRKYFIQRSLGWNTGRFRRFDPDDIKADDDADEDPDLSASRAGSAVHEILAGLTPSEDSRDARQLADVFLNSELGRRAVASPRVAREWAFIADIDGTIIRGSIDLWFEHDGEIHVVDYKTDAVTAAEAPARALDYVPQLALYAKALERALGKRPKVAWLHFLRPDTIVEIALDDVRIAAARNLVGSLRKAQDKLRFDLNEGDHCRTCQFFRSLCPAGRT
jgi:ATP-dependent exoDNAse (exonuclease V) beta subunit